MNIFENHSQAITKLLKILWIKKLYPFVLYSLKKLEYLIDDEKIKIYNINKEIIDFRYFAHYNIALTEKEILLYFEVLENFIEKELFKSKAEIAFNDYLLERENWKFKNNEYLKYLYRGYLQNYIELQLYLIILSLKKLNSSGIKKPNISKQIVEIIIKYNERSFYANRIMKEIYNIDTNTKFMFYTFNEKYQFIEKHINIIESIIREKNVLSNYNPNKAVMKEVMYKNLLNERYLFINNHIEDNNLELKNSKYLSELNSSNSSKNNQNNRNEENKENDDEQQKKSKYLNELITFLFVPLKKELLPQYLQTAQKIYDDFWS